MGLFFFNYEYFIPIAIELQRVCVAALFLGQRVDLGLDGVDLVLVLLELLAQALQLLLLVLAHEVVLVGLLALGKVVVGAPAADGAVAGAVRVGADGLLQSEGAGDGWACYKHRGLCLAVLVVCWKEHEGGAMSVPRVL